MEEQVFYRDPVAERLEAFASLSNDYSRYQR